MPGEVVVAAQPAFEPGDDGGPDVEVPGGEGDGDVLGLPDGAEVGVVGHIGGMGEEAGRSLWRWLA